jgi:hypothetical protein
MASGPDENPKSNPSMESSLLFTSCEIKLETALKAVRPFAGMTSFFAMLESIEFSKTFRRGDGIRG